MATEEEKLIEERERAYRERIAELKGEVKPPPKAPPPPKPKPRVRDA